jgi:hypothetical protein
MVRFCFVVLLMSGSLMAQPPAQPPVTAVTPAPTRPVRPPAPTRDPHTAGYVKATELPDGENAPAQVDGNFILVRRISRRPRWP